MEKKDLKTMVESTDMSDEMRRFAIKTAEKLVLQNTDSDSLAQELCAAFDLKFGTGWSCAAGRDFGGFISYRPGTFIFFYVGRSMVVLFRTK